MTNGKVTITRVRLSQRSESEVSLRVMNFGRRKSLQPRTYRC